MTGRGATKSGFMRYRLIMSSLVTPRLAMTYLAVIALVFGLVAVGAPAQAAGNGPYDIMKAEPATPGVAPPYRSPRRSRQHVKPLPKAKPPRQRSDAPPPPIVVPQSGRVVPSVPVVPRGSVPGGGRESFGDRAARCAHQGGLAGLPNDQQNSYMGTCLNQ